MIIFMSIKTEKNTQRLRQYSNYVRKQISSRRVYGKMTQIFANKCQMEIIYIPFKQSFLDVWLFRSGQLEKYPQDKNTVHPECSMEVWPAEQ